MKTIKILLIKAIMLIMAQTSFSQDIAADTTLAKQYYALGDGYYNSQDLDSSTFYYQRAADVYKQIAEKTNDTLMWEKHVNCLYDVSWNFTSQSQFKSSIEIFDTALFIALKYLHKNNKQTAKIYAGMGVVYAGKSEYDKALEYFFKSLEISLELLSKKHTYVANLYNNIGNVYEEKSEYDKSLEFHFKSLEIQLELLGEKHTSVARSYNNIGNVYSDKSEYDKALEYYFKSLEIKLELLGEKHSDVAIAYNNIGIVYRNKSEYDKALEYHSKSLEIKLELLGEKHTLVASSYNSIGAIYENKSEYDKALEYHLKSLEINKELIGEKHTFVAGSYNNIGLVYMYKSKYDKSLEYYLKSLEIRLELLGEKHTDVASSYIGIGGVYAHKSEYDLALEYYQKGIASCLLYFNDSINIFSVQQIKDYMDWNMLSKALQAKAQIFANDTIDIEGFKISAGMKDRYKLALRHYQACDTLITQVRKKISTKSDKIALGEKANEVYKEAVDVCLDLSELAKKDSSDYYKQLAFQFSEKNKSSVLLESLAGSEAMKFAGIPDNLLEKEHDLQIDIALYKRLLSEQHDSAQENNFRSKLFNANRSYDSLMQMFEKEYPKYHELKYGQNLATVEQLQQTLDKSTAMISYLESDSSITIFKLTQKDFNIHKVAKVADYEDLIVLTRSNITTHQGDNKIYLKAAHSLYKQLFPFELGKKIENLIIIPDGSMSLIPFEALLTHDFQGDQYFYAGFPFLLNKYNISYSYSANLFIRTFPKEKSKEVEVTPLNDWLAFAPVFDDKKTGGATLRTRELLREMESVAINSTKTRGTMLSGEYITPLPGTESEVKSIFKKFEEKGKKATVQLNENASEEYVKSGALKDYKYIHFASHGIVNTWKPELSGIILAQDSTSKEDGILHTGEMYNLELNADLTVLSACETGLGEIKKGEGLIGLSRALLYAGSKNIIVSLWKVADNSTKQLMVDFYANLLENEKNTNYAESLRKAKLKMISEGKYAHPYFWSPFILIGK